MARNRLVVIISGCQIPNGGAYGNRLLSYARGLKELGEDVMIFGAIPRDTDLSQGAYRGVIRGVKFKFFSNLSYSKSSFIKKVLFYVYTLVRLSFQLLVLRFSKQEKISAIIQVDYPMSILVYAILARCMGIKTFRDVVEYPEHVMHKNLSTIATVKSKAILFLERKLFVGLFFITETLEKFHMSKGTFARHLVIPMTVEPDRFECNSGAPKEQYISYCGSMYGNKDGVPQLVEAFTIVARDFKNIKLRLIGDNSKSEAFQMVSQKINQSPFKGRIEMTGKVKRDEMPALLCDSIGLALARPANKQAEGGFPTKLGEYLSTGNPVIVTPVGEIPKYLADGVNAFVSEDTSPESFARKLCDLLGDLDRAEKIGMRGKELSSTTFNYLVQSERLRNFIWA